MNENALNVNKAIDNINEFIDNYGIGFMTEDQLRLCFIRGLGLKAEDKNAVIERPYIYKEDKHGNNYGILNIDNSNDIPLKPKSRAELDLFYIDKEKNENYIEFKYHYSYNGDCPNTKFGDVMDDLHRLSLLCSRPSNSKKNYYLVYAFNEIMKDKIESWNENLREITSLFCCDDKINPYEAVQYTRLDFMNIARGPGEFRKESFSSFDRENGCWHPQDLGFLDKIYYNRCCNAVIKIPKQEKANDEEELTLVILQIMKKQ